MLRLVRVYDCTLSIALMINFGHEVIINNAREVSLRTPNNVHTKVFKVCVVYGYSLYMYM